MKRSEWLKLTPREKIIHHVQRTIDRIGVVQARYKRLKASGRIAKPIPFIES